MRVPFSPLSLFSLLARRPRLRRALHAGSRLTCAALGVGFALAWVLSSRYPLRASYAQGGGVYLDALAVAGHLRLVHVSDWPGAASSRWKLACGDDVDQTTGLSPGHRPGASLAVWNQVGVEGASGLLVTSLRRRDREPVWPPQELTMATLTRSRADTMAGRGRSIASPLLPFHGLRMPLWLPAAVLGLWPLAHLAGRLASGDRRRRRVLRGWCIACGYDRNGIEGPCPECSAG